MEIPRDGASAVYLGLDWFVLGVLTTAAVFVPLEGAFPLRRGQSALRRGWLTDTQYLFASHVLAQFALAVLVADLAQYGVHRAFHAVPALWRFHKVHHSVEVMDWLAGSRLHLVDVIARADWCCWRWW